LDNNGIRNIRPTIRQEKLITSRGKFLW
jgi:hypothetical protein